MSTTHQYQRGEVNTARLHITKANIGAGNAQTVMLRKGSFLKNVTAFVRTAFDGTAAVTLTVTDGTTTLINAQSVTSASATTAVTVAASLKDFPNGGTISAYITDGTTTASTVGEVVVEFEYTDGSVEYVYDGG